MNNLAYTFRTKLAFMKHYYLLCILCLVTLNSKATELDSLKALLPIKSGKEKAILLSRISDICDENDVYFYAKACYDLSLSIPYQEGITDGLHNMGVYYQIINKHDSALHFLRQAEARKISGNESQERKNYTQVALVTSYTEQGKYQIAESLLDRLLLTVPTSEAFSYSELLNQKGYIRTQVGDFKNSISPFIKSYELKYKMDNIHGAIVCLMNIANSYNEMNEYAQVRNYYLRALKLNNNQDQKLQAAIMNGLGVAYLKMDNYAKALAYNDSSITRSKSTHSYQTLASNYLNRGELFAYLKEYDIALKCYHQSIQVAKDHNLIQQFAITYNNIGQSYVKKKDFTKAYKYYQLGKNYAQKYQDLKVESMIQSNIAIYYYEQKKKDSAYMTLKQSIPLFQQINNSMGLANIYLNLGQWYIKDEDIENAEKYALLGLELSKKIDKPSYVVKATGLLAEIYAKQKNYKSAYEMQAMMARKSDSIHSDTTRIKILKQEFNEQLDSTKKTNKVEVQFFKHLVANQRIIFLIILLVVVVLFGILFSKFRNKKKKKEHDLEIELMVKRLGILQSQLNTHFNSNILQTISNYIGENKNELAEEISGKFAKLNRMVLRYADQKSITIEDEIEFLKLYIEVGRIRLRYPCTYDIQSNAKECHNTTHIPVMMLQPLVENCIAHGFPEKTTAGHIQIEFFLDEDVVMVKITDNGDAKINSSTNLSNPSMSSQLLNERIDLYRQIYNNKVSMQTTLRDATPSGNGFEVEIKLPILT